MKENFFSKLVKKGYNDNLEEILSKKEFSEEVKSSLLSIFYKIESGYDDYKKVKRGTYEKKQYIEMLTDIIDKNCNSIEFIKNNNKKELVDQNKKIIKCEQIDLKILSSLGKMSKKHIISQYGDENIDIAFSNVLNIGNNISIEEPLRDFNGFSWNIIVKEIEDLKCNLIYQNILYLVGNEFLEKWINDYDTEVNYLELFEQFLNKKYNNKMKRNIIKFILNISIIINASYSEKFEKKIYKAYNSINDEYNHMKNSKDYIEKISRKKRRKQDILKNIDQILNTKKLLLKEFQKEKEIVNIEVYKEKLKEERKKIVKELKELTNSVKPYNYIKKQNEIKDKIDILNISNGDLKLQYKKRIIEFQKIIINCMKIDLKKITEKNELIDFLYKFRYYNLIPITSKRCIYQIKELENELNNLLEDIIKKATEMKVINVFFKDHEMNTYLIKSLLNSKIITLENINIKIITENGELYLIILDEMIQENKIKLEGINSEKIKIKLDKKTRFIL